MSSFTLVTGGYDSTIRFFDATNQTLQRTINFCDQQVLRLAFSWDSPVQHNAPLYLIAGGSPSVCVYDVTHSETNPTLFQVHTGHTDAITAVGFEPRYSAFVFSASEDGLLQTWIPTVAAHRASGTPVVYGTGPGMLLHPMHSGVFTPDGRQRYETVPATIHNVSDDNTGLVPIRDAVFYQPADFFFTADDAGRFRVWRHKSSKIPLVSLLPHPSRRNLQCIEVSKQTSTVILANFDGFVFVYNIDIIIAYIDDSKQNPVPAPIVIRANNRYIPRLRLSVSGEKLVCTTSSGTIKLFRMSDIRAHAEKKRRAALKAAARNAQHSINYSEDGDADNRDVKGDRDDTVGSGNEERNYDKDNNGYPDDVDGREGQEIKDDNDDGDDDDEDFVADDDEHGNKPSDTKDNYDVAPLREFTGQQGWIWDAAFVEDRDDYLFTCSSNMQVMLWSLHELQNSSEYPGHSKGVVTLAVRERMSHTPDPYGGGAQAYDYGQSVVDDTASDMTNHSMPNNETGAQHVDA